MKRTFYYILITLSVTLLQTDLPSLSKSLGTHQSDNSNFGDATTNSQTDESPASLYKSAEDFQHEGQLDQAAAKYLQAQKAIEKLLGSDNLELARCSLRLATIYDAQKKSKQADSEWEASFKICKLALGSEFKSSKLAASSRAELLVENNQAVNEIKTQNYNEAISILESVLRRDPDYKLARDTLSIAYQNYALSLRNTPNQALSWMRRAVYLQPADEIKRNNYDGLTKLMGKNPLLTSTHISLGAACNEAGDNQGAIVEYSRSMEIDPTSVPSNYPLYGEALGLLGERQSVLGKRDEAEVSLKQALNWMDQHKTGFIQVKRYGRDLADLYKASNKSEEATVLEHKYALNEGTAPVADDVANSTPEKLAAQKELNKAATNFSDGNFREAQSSITAALPFLEKNKETMAPVLAAAQYNLLLAEDKQNHKPELAKYLPSVVEHYLHNGWKSSVDFSTYMSDLDKQVKGYWNPPHIAKSSKKTLLRFKIGRFGDFSDVRIASSSGLIPLDDAAIEAFGKVGRAKPLPDGAPDSVDVEFHFDYNVHRPGENTASESSDQKSSTW